MKNEKLIGTGKYLFVVPFFVIGLFHFMDSQSLSAMIPSFIPGSVFWIYLTGAALMIASISIFMGSKAKPIMRMVALTLFLIALVVHFPATLADVGAAPHLFKDLSLSGCILLLGSTYGR